MHVGDVDVLDAVQKALKTLDVLLVLGVHDRQEQRVDVFLDVLDLVDALADDVVQLDQALGVVGLDVHQGVDAVVGLGVLAEKVLDLVAVLQDPVDLLLDQGVGEHLLAQGLVAGVEDADALPQPPVEPVGPRVERLKDLPGAFEPVEQRISRGSCRWCTGCP